MKCEDVIYCAARNKGRCTMQCNVLPVAVSIDSSAAINQEMLSVLKDILRVTNMTSRASHSEQTAIFSRMKKVITEAESASR